MTTPFSDSLINKIKSLTAWVFDGEINPEPFTPRFFCCTDPNDLGLDPGKEPVAVIELYPNPAFVGDTITFDGTDSYDPDGSIVSYAWKFEGQTPSTSSSSNGTFTAMGPGIYTIELKVTDGTGLVSSPARVELVVNNNDGLLAFFVATEDGVFYTNNGGDSWQDKNVGISGYSLYTYDVTIDPATINNNVSNQAVWRAGEGAVYSSGDGGDSWLDQTPSSVPNDWLDSPSPTPSDLSYIQIDFGGNRLYLLGTWQNSIGDWRSWLWYTDNANFVRQGNISQVNWVNVVTSWGEGS